ncbi:MBL fold metallo-hydrolase [[Mycobacterium] burgundiense]|uniref:MBL fold metallo-hydrolase n=1 Tax=[Mycobacterium] burgundiense TaxID=3064286 RepID=A0ABM9LAF8_9MYCO|nr:MBL fold metallo-hydrolase [Mycolicibacterium sp. MU0053]CAJ1495678.1 MBL fold metallo-hydrolase [Mycolicibacterium sp. MU0053]
MTDRQRFGQLEILRFQTGLVRTNCYLVFHHADREALIIDPGDGASARVRDLVRQHRLAPRAVLLTHGHLDHVWSAQRLSDHYAIPTCIHVEDRAMLVNPIRGVAPKLVQRLVGVLCSEPEQVVELSDGAALTLGGIAVSVDHTPGHTPGSVTFRVADPHHPDLLFTGDTLFNGSVGRTDFEGGSGNHLLGSIINKLLVRDDRALVLPGHGAQSTIGLERRTNPFLIP